MLRHVLCVLALALCCCTSVCVAAAAAAAGASERISILGLLNDVSIINLTERFDADSCKPPSNPLNEGVREVTITTTPTLTKQGKSGVFLGQTELQKKITVPAGYNVELKNSLDKCMKKGSAAAGAAATETSCTFDGSEADTDRITYNVSVGTTATDSDKKTNIGKEGIVTVPDGYSITSFVTVLIKCTPPPAVQPPPPAAMPPAPGAKKEGLNDTEGSAKASSLGSPPRHRNTISEENGKPSTKAQDLSEKPDTTANVVASTSSEAESKETDNSFTVNGADHTAPTATPQSETTTEGAPNTDAGMSTSAGEGVKLPDRNTDASSSSSAWARAPILLLLACVAVW
ncbi:hypothetical protein DQ04_11991020 [Trypanosoma grayi]|uniref:hypothetical protein n=1 Tax=Trypanosoma grayi TaxID=71804 RepID=UPI0004F4AF48|nr:hypothetical protein DQ04_11991020 [Trypanosoma grayi]KEG06838.1 hypothetical protein DQ04_11991020 [Trypanosoma grayi]